MLYTTRETSNPSATTPESPEDATNEQRISRWASLEVLLPLFHAATKRLQIAETAALNKNQCLANLQLRQAKRLFEELQSHLRSLDKEMSLRFATVISYLECCMSDVNHDHIGFARHLLVQRRDFLTNLVDDATAERPHGSHNRTP